MPDDRPRHYTHEGNLPTACGLRDPFLRTSGLLKVTCEACRAWCRANPGVLFGQKTPAWWVERTPPADPFIEAPDSPTDVDNFTDCTRVGSTAAILLAARARLAAADVGVSVEDHARLLARFDAEAHRLCSLSVAELADAVLERRTSALMDDANDTCSDIASGIDRGFQPLESMTKAELIAELWTEDLGSIEFADLYGPSWNRVMSLRRLHRLVDHVANEFANDLTLNPKDAGVSVSLDELRDITFRLERKAWPKVATEADATGAEPWRGEVEAYPASVKAEPQAVDAVGRYVLGPGGTFVARYGGRPMVVLDGGPDIGLVLAAPEPPDAWYAEKPPVTVVYRRGSDKASSVAITGDENTNPARPKSKG